MRDLVLIAFVLGSLPLILFRPYVGVLIFAWLGYLNPHQQFAWNIARDVPLSAIVAATTLAAMVWSKETRKLPLTPITAVWLVWILWMTVTTQFALFPEEAVPRWTATMKIQLMSLVTIMLLQSKKRILLLVWIITYSVGYYGLKGGIFTILTGGQQVVWGPDHTFFAGNNELGIALLMVMPWMFFLANQCPRKWIRVGILVGLGLTAMAVVATYSRGAFIAGSVMIAYLATKLRNKIILLPFLFAGVAGLAAFMPEQYYDRIGTIANYEEDQSAMRRITAWTTAWRVAKDRPLVGGGFNSFKQELYERYFPEEEVGNVNVHSIYFEALGEHGFVGGFLFVLLLIMAMYQCGSIRRAARAHADLQWATDLASLTQVGLLAYAVGGAFLGLADFDLYYHLVAIVVLTRIEVDRRLTAPEVETRIVPSDEGFREIVPDTPRLQKR